MEQLREYGPSNWRKRGPEARMIKVHGREEADVVAMWHASDLMREQTSNALTAGENSPDAYMGLAHYIHEPAHWRDEDRMEAFNQHIAAYTAQITTALKQLVQVEGMTGDVGMSLLQKLGNDGFKATESNRQLWLEVSQALEKVAVGQDEKARRELAI